MLLNIFRDQVIREKNRKEDEYKRRQIVKKRFEIILMQRELQKHIKELHFLLSPSSGNIEASIADLQATDLGSPNFEATDPEPLDFEATDLEPSDFKATDLEATDLEPSELEVER